MIQVNRMDDGLTSPRGFPCLRHCGMLVGTARETKGIPMSTGRELLNTSEGTGEVQDTNGERIGDGQYELHVFRESHNDPGGQAHSFEEIEGAITGIDATARIGDPLVLALEDGRKLDFYFQDSDGTIVARGDFRH